MRGRYKILLLVLAMVLSTFATAFTYDDYEGNDSYTFKHNSGSSSTWYFNEDGEKVNGPTDYWIKFVVSGDELSFTTKNIELDLLSIKGGNYYRVYLDLGDSESGLTAPINEANNKPYGISHYSFEMTIVPPEKPDVRVEKSIKDRDDGESLAEFEFELWKNGEKVYGPETTNSSGFASFKDVEPGTYDVVELLTNAQKEIYIPEEDVTVKVDEGEEGLVTVSFENSKMDEPEMAKVRVIKEIEFKNDQEIMLSSTESGDSLAGFEFELWQNGSKVYGPETTNSSGFAIFDDVEPGTYEVKEFLTTGQQEMYEPEEDVTVTVDIGEEGTVSVYFKNYKEKDTPPEKDEGSLKVHKRIEYPDGRVAANIGDGIFTLRLTGPEGDDSEVRTETIPGNGEHATFDNLPFGTYLLEETDIDHEGYSYDGTPRFQIFGNQNPADVSYGSVEIEIDSKGQTQYWVINVLGDTPPPPELGEIEISKLLVDEDDDEITNDNTNFTFKVEMKVAEGEGFVWEEIDESPVTLKGGESKTLEGLPLGEYRITEISIPDGYMLHADTDNPQVTTLEADGDVDEVMFTNVRDDETPPPPELGEIEVTKIVQNRFGNGISSSTRFYFELQMFNDDEEWEVKEEKSILGNGTVTFDDLEDGLYRVREVSINSAFRLFSDNNVEAEIIESSSEEVEFINRLRPPSIDDDDDDRPPRRDDDDDEEEPVVESVTVTPDPVPQAPPVIVVEQPEPEPEIEVVEEATPLATLPRTGASDPTVFAGFGAAFMALGLYLKKKRF